MSRRLVSLVIALLAGASLRPAGAQPAPVPSPASPAGAVPAPVTATATATPVFDVPICRTTALTLTATNGDGAYEGMSQNGVLLHLTNRGQAACAVSRRPAITFYGKRHRAVGLIERAPRVVGMHPGPVVTPIVLAPGASLTAKLHWVQGDVYGPGGSCYTGTTIGYAPPPAGSATLDVANPFRVCGPGGQPTGFDAEPWSADDAS